MNSSKSATIATVLVAVFAVVIAVIAVSKYAGAKQEETEIDEDINEVFIPSDEVSEEMKDAAARLIEQNYTVVKLFYTIGMPHEEEPYGNLPESGYYNAVSDEYTSAEQIYALLDNTFLSNEANHIRTDPLGFGAPLYIDKDNGKLGIHADFEPDYDYPVNWSSPSYVVIPISNTECTLRVTLDVNGTSVTENLEMTKLNGQWLLDRILY